MSADMAKPTLTQGLDPLALQLAQYLARWETDEGLRSLVFKLGILLAQQLDRGSTVVDIAALSSSSRADAGSGSDADLNPAMIAEQLPRTVCGGEQGPICWNPPLISLRRYAQAESKIARLLARLTTPESQQPDIALEQFAKLFPKANNPDEVDWQAVAALAIASRRFALLSGGPGTGKTHSIVRALLLLNAAAGYRASDIALAAPTGKAAARLLESVRAAATALPEMAQASLPEQAYTLHRLLGIGGALSSPRYNAINPLAFKIVVVDEASMLDVQLAQQLLEAIPATGRLVLVGDAAQLPAVGVGDVFGEIVRALKSNTFTSRTRQWMQLYATLPAQEKQSTDQAGEPLLQNRAVTLLKTYRFDQQSSLGGFIHACGSGDTRRALDCLTNADDALQLADPSGFVSFLTGEYLASWARISQSDAALQLLNRQCILCALQQGPFGVQGVQQRIAALAQRTALTYIPIMVRRNNDEQQLYNGDLGVQQVATGNAWFPGADQHSRMIAEARIPLHTAAWALTVHKAQGSEFSHVHLLLPNRDHPLLDRRWLYTAASRAKTRLTIWSSPERIERTIARNPVRASSVGVELRTALTKETP